LTHIRLLLLLSVTGYRSEILWNPTTLEWISTTFVLSSHHGCAIILIFLHLWRVPQLQRRRYSLRFHWQSLQSPTRQRNSHLHRWRGAPKRRRDHDSTWEGNWRIHNFHRRPLSELRVFLLLLKRAHCFLECSVRKSLLVLSVFYDVDPSHVMQTSSKLGGRGSSLTWRSWRNGRWLCVKQLICLAIISNKGTLFFDLHHSFTLLLR